MFKCRDKVIVTIGRAFGSGGREIGRKVSKELGIPFYDRELLAIEAKDGRYGFHDLAKFDEKHIGNIMFSMSPYPVEQMARDIQAKAIKSIADEGSCVIIGRRADKILRGEYDILSVFISAPFDKRITRVAERDGLSEKDSKKKIKEADRERRSFYNAYWEGEWGEAGSYNLCIDSGRLGIDGSAAMILKYLELKEKIVQI